MSDHNPSSETFRNVPHDAEPYGTVPHDAESYRALPKVAERTENHTLSVREVARMFEAAGVARIERSIVNWCHPNRHGYARLDCFYDANERKYFITPQSVELAIKEERAKATKKGDGAEPYGKLPHAERQREPQEEPITEDERDRSKSLQQEIMDLKITNRAKDIEIGRLYEERDEERGDFALERNEYVEKLMSFNRKVGELETKLLQLEAPKHEMGPRQYHPE